MLVHTLPPLVGATVLCVPSIHSQDPYSADIELDDGRVSVCHTPGVPCGAEIGVGSRIYVSENDDASITTEWTAQISDEGDAMVGIHPVVSHQAIYTLLNRIHPDAEWACDVTVKNCTIDYVGYLPTKKKVYLQVTSILTPPNDGRIVFPEVPVSQSPVQTNVLQSLVGRYDTHSCHILFIIPRADCTSLLINSNDKEYQSKLLGAVEKGVRLHTFVLEYDPEGDIHFKQTIRVKFNLLSSR